MEITKKVTLPIKVTGKTKNKVIEIENLPTLLMVMGTSSVSGNLHYYKIKKEGKKYLVPFEVFLNRIKLLEQRMEEIDNKLSILREIQKGCKRWSN